VSKHLSGKAVLGAVALSIAFILGSSIYVYALGDYVSLGDSKYVGVDLRIDKINTQPRNFVIVLASVKITNHGESDIDVHVVRVSAYSDPDPGATLYGEETKENVLIPALSVKVVRMNVKIYHWADFLKDDSVYALSYISWTHFGSTNERIDMTVFDMTDYAAMLGLL
jgi:hypothetical protein